ncbi:MAG TPA: hypothetical protein VMT87_07780 [Vicinamibacteria bacterium]|nr:hypothetical protein [Vicinamibacteria bacterium]
MAGAALLVLGVAIAGRSYCPMRSPASAAGEQREPHDCCKKGVTGARPSCCHADSGTVAVALLKTTSAVTLPAAASWMVPLPVEATSVYARASSVAAHSPPPRVLRI